MKRTKIVCTIGPASQSSPLLKKMIREGMNVARLNFSHGTHASHRSLIRAIRSAAAAVGEPVAILGDLQGPKIRLGTLPEAGVEFRTGSIVAFTTSTTAYKEGILPVTYRDLHHDVKPGHRMLIDDGLIEVRIERVSGKTLWAEVVNGGRVTSHKGLNFPDTNLRVSSLTKKDRDDVVFGVREGVDWMALSFVTNPEDVRLLRRLIRRAGKRGQVLPRIIVKVEKHEAIDQFEEILSVADGVMVARGDLGIEIPAEEVPVRQKELIEKCRNAGKPVVVATQMLDSMIRNPRPTRAEVSDVANAVFDHTDAVMLSGETATGKYPLEAVQTMKKIVAKAEASRFDDLEGTDVRKAPWPVAVAHTLKDLADSRRIRGVVAFAATATWAETLLLARPEIPLFLVVPNETLARQVNIRWGLHPIVMPGKDVGRLLPDALKQLKRNRFVKKGARLAVVLDGPGREGVEIVSIK